jgi:nucleoside-diphosphate-sugar epimerase
VAIDSAVSGGKTTARLIRAPQQLDLADAEAIRGAFIGLDILVHLAATIHADAGWDTVSRNNIVATQHVAEECARSGVRRLVFASSNHTQAADFYTSLDPAAPGGLNTMRPEFLQPNPPTRALSSVSAPGGYYAPSKLPAGEMCKFYSFRHGLETVCLRIGWFKGGHLESEADQLAELAELQGSVAQDYMRAMWLSREDALQIICAACTTDSLPAKWPESNSGPHAVAYAISNNARKVFDLAESVAVLGYQPVDDYDVFACSLL